MSRGYLVNAELLQAIRQVVREFMAMEGTRSRKQKRAPRGAGGGVTVVNGGGEAVIESRFSVATANPIEPAISLDFEDLDAGEQTALNAAVAAVTDPDVVLDDGDTIIRAGKSVGNVDTYVAVESGGEVYLVKTESGGQLYNFTPAEIHKGRMLGVSEFDGKKFVIVDPCA